MFENGDRGGTSCDRAFAGPRAERAYPCARERQYAAMPRPSGTVRRQKGDPREVRGLSQRKSAIFVDWLLSDDDRNVIAEFRMDGQQLLFPNAEG